MATKIRLSNITQPLDQDLSVPNLTASGNIASPYFNATNIATGYQLNGTTVLNYSGGNVVLGDLGAGVGLDFNGSNKLITSNTGITVSGNTAITGGISFAGQPSYTSNSLGVYATGTWLNSPASTNAFLGIGGTGILKWKSSGVDITGDLTVSGDFTVSGNTTFINSDNLTIEDLNIVLANGAANSAIADGAGITIDGANATFTWNDTDSTLDFNKDIKTTGQSIYLFDTNNRIRVDQSSATFMQFDLAGSEKFRLRRVGSDDVQLVPKQYSTGTTAAAYPAYTFSEDDDSGLAWMGANAIQLVTGGTTRVIVDSAGHMTIGRTSTVGIVDTIELHGGNIINPNSSNTEITSATLGFGTNIHLEERQPVGAFSDRTDLAFVLDTGYGLGESEKFRMTSGGNFGIGTDAPGNLLHVKSNINNGAVITLESTATDSYPFLRLKNDAREYQITAHGPLGDKFTIYDGTAGAHRFTIDTSGNVGINNTSPQSTLDVASGTALGSILRRDFNGAVANTASKVALTLWAQDHDSADTGQGTIANIGPMIGFGARIDDGAPNTGDIRAGIAYSYNGDLTFHAKSAASVADGSYERVRIDGATGNVGIGTDAPSEKLQISPDDGGDTRSITTRFSSAGVYNPAATNTEEKVATGLRFNWYSEYWQIGAARGGATDIDGLVISENGNERLVIDNNGNVGIGTASPVSNLHVKNSSTTTDSAVLVNKTETAFGWEEEWWFNGRVTNTSAGTMYVTFTFSNPSTTNIHQMSIDYNVSCYREFSTTGALEGDAIKGTGSYYNNSTGGDTARSGEVEIIGVGIVTNVFTEDTGTNAFRIGFEYIADGRVKNFVGRVKLLNNPATGSSPAVSVTV